MSVPVESFGMFYTNFLVMDRARLAQRSDIWQFTDAAVDGIVRHRWGDAPLWTAIASIFMEPRDLLHLNSFAYQHGRRNRFIVLPGNEERIEWNVERWKNQTGLQPNGHCIDRRIPVKCVYLEQGHLEPRG